MKNIAIILLAGDSKRFANAKAKQFYEINNHPLAHYSIKPLATSKSIDSLVIVSKKEDEEKIKEIMAEFNKPVFYVTGGTSRHESVNNALKFLKDKISDDDNILIHDGARPFLEEEQIKELLKTLKKYEAATLAIPLEDTIALVNDDELQEVPNRNKYMKIQTPQAFKFKTLLLAHENCHLDVTDDSQLCLSIGVKVAVIKGSKRLNKVTTIEDIANVEEIIKNDY